MSKHSRILALAVLSAVLISGLAQDPEDEPATGVGLAIVASPPPPPPAIPAEICGPFGYYRISCYTANISPENATDAKNQCITAWNKPAGCSGVVLKAGRNIVNCPTSVITYFLPTQDCRTDYQAQQGTNPGCALFASLGLGNSANRVTFAGSQDYVCSGIPPPPPPSPRPPPPSPKSPPPPSPKSPPPPSPRRPPPPSPKSPPPPSPKSPPPPSPRRPPPPSPKSPPPPSPKSPPPRSPPPKSPPPRSPPPKSPPPSPPPPRATGGGPCLQNGFYRVSCFQNITPAEAKAARDQCLSAWQAVTPGCSYSIVIAQENLDNCPTGLATWFNTAACRSAYQAQQGTNPACILAQTVLLNPLYRVTYQFSQDYQCAN